MGIRAGPSGPPQNSVGGAPSQWAPATEGVVSSMGEMACQVPPRALPRGCRDQRDDPRGGQGRFTPHGEAHGVPPASQAQGVKVGGPLGKERADRRPEEGPQYGRTRRAHSSQDWQRDQPQASQAAAASPRQDPNELDSFSWASDGRAAATFGGMIAALLAAAGGEGEAWVRRVQGQATFTAMGAAAAAPAAPRARRSGRPTPGCRAGR